MDGLGGGGDGRAAAARGRLEEREDEAEEERSSARGASPERYFSARWMLERERAGDDCSSAFAIIPVGEHCGEVVFLSLGFLG